MYPDNGISINTQIAAVAETADFTPQPVIEGPLVSTTGIAIAIGIITIAIVEYLKNHPSSRKQ